MRIGAVKTTRTAKGSELQYDNLFNFLAMILA